MYEQIKKVLMTEFKVPEAEILPAVTLSELGLDSMDRVELSLALTQQIGVPIPEDELLSVERLDQIVALLEDRAPGASDAHK